MLPLNTRLDDDGDVQFPALAENDRAVRIVQSCRHLGTIVQAGDGMGREIASRANAGQAATHALSRWLLGNEGLPRHVRVQVAQACVASRCLHQAGTWDELQGRQLQRLKVAWSRPWRSIAGAHRPPPGQSWKSNDEVQKELQVAELEDELACMRLLYMARAARSAPPYALAMLQTGAAAAWRSAMVEDMECMFQLLLPKLDALGSPHEAPARWEEFGKSWPRQWQTLVALFAERRKGLKENAASADFTRSSGDEFLCPGCGDVFPTPGRLKCHRGKAHKVRRSAARFVRDGVCPHCRVDFHCRKRAMAHVEKGAKSCREALMRGLLLELTEEELREADQELVRYRRQAL